MLSRTMVRLAACLALALSSAQGMMSLTKHASLNASQQLSHATQEPPKNFLVLRLAHSGSSWLTAMISSQEGTYVTREAMYWMHNQTDREYVASLDKEAVLNYLERALAEPSGDILKPDKIQHGPLSCSEVPKAKAKAQRMGLALISEASSTHPKTCHCLRTLGSNCTLKFLGLTLDPMSQGLNENGKNLSEILTAIQEKHPDMPVLVYRRSNIVKHSIATGGLAENEPGKYGVPLHQAIPVEQLLGSVAAWAAADKVLRQAGAHFRNVKTVTYEDLVSHPRRVMEGVFKFLGMPYHFDDFMAVMGDKHSPEDLRLRIQNFDEVQHALEKVSPCLVKQLLAATNENFAEPCEDDLSIHPNFRVLR